MSSKLLERLTTPSHSTIQPSKSQIGLATPRNRTNNKVSPSMRKKGTLSRCMSPAPGKQKQDRNNKLSFGSNIAKTPLANYATQVPSSRHDNRALTMS